MTQREEAKKKYGKDVKHWSDQDIMLYMEVGKIPDKTKRGVWVTDILRDHRLTNWSQEALLSWADGEIQTPGDVVDEDIWDEINTRWKIPGNWTRDDLITFLTRGIMPVEIEPGIIANDKIRNAKTITQLSFTDIRLALEDKVVLKFSKDELYAEVKHRLSLTPNFPDSRIIKSLPQVEKEMSTVNTLLESKLNEYKKARLDVSNGRKPSVETHAAAQSMLFSAITSVMNRPYKEFVSGWEMILDFINKEYQGLFDERNCLIGLPQAAITPTDKSTYADILNLMIHTRAPQRRKALARTYHLPTILRHVKSDLRRDNVIQYYTID